MEGNVILNIKKYKDYFHDGGLIDVCHEKDSISLSICSAEMSQEDFHDILPLSKNNYLKGKLYVEEISNVKLDNQPYRNKMKMEHDSAQILSLEIDEHSVVLEIVWEDYPPKKSLDSNCSIYCISGKKIYWESIPSLIDPFW